MESRAKIKVWVRGTDMRGDLIRVSGILTKEAGPRYAVRMPAS